MGVDDSGFSGLDLATLIRNKYGRSYDVQLIKKVHNFSYPLLCFYIKQSARCYIYSSMLEQLRVVGSTRSSSHVRKNYHTA